MIAGAQGYREETHTIASKATGHAYQVYVLLPEGYDNGTKSYPVLYATDASTVRDLLFRNYEELRSAGKISEAIIVAIGYVDESKEAYHEQRWADFTPTHNQAIDDAFKKQLGPNIESGKAAAFLSAMKSEIAPFIETKFRANGRRSFLGYSLGGLFGTYVLFHDTGFFTSYTLGSASLWWDEQVCLTYEKTYAEKHSDLESRVVFCYGSLEAPDITKTVPAMVDALNARKYKGLALSTRVVDDKNHSTVVPDLVRIGLTEMLALDPRFT